MATKVIDNNDLPAVIANAKGEEYRGSHEAPGPHFGAQLHELNKIYPEDIYSEKAAYYYGDGGGEKERKMDKVSTRLAQSYRGKPDANVKIFRAVPDNEKINSINPGDWVTINHDYAKLHGESVLNGKYKILEHKAKAKDVWTNADSIHEYGYYPTEE